MCARCQWNCEPSLLPTGHLFVPTRPFFSSTQQHWHSATVPAWEATWPVGHDSEVWAFCKSLSFPCTAREGKKAPSTMQPLSLSALDCKTSDVREESDFAGAWRRRVVGGAYSTGMWWLLLPQEMWERTTASALLQRALVLHSRCFYPVPQSCFRWSEGHLLFCPIGCVNPCSAFCHGSRPVFPAGQLPLQGPCALLRTKALRKCPLQQRSRARLSCQQEQGGVRRWYQGGKAASVGRDQREHALGRHWSPVGSDCGCCTGHWETGCVRMLRRLGRGNGDPYVCWTPACPC